MKLGKQPDLQKDVYLQSLCVGTHSYLWVMEFQTPSNVEGCMKFRENSLSDVCMDK